MFLLSRRDNKTRHEKMLLLDKVMNESMKLETSRSRVGRATHSQRPARYTLSVTGDDVKATDTVH